MSESEKSSLKDAFKSFIKVTWTAALGQMGLALSMAYATNNDIFSWDETIWKPILGSVVGAVILVWKNYKDPKFPLYGEKPKEEIVVDNPEVNTP